MLSLFTYGLTLGAAEYGTDTKELSEQPFVFQPSHDIPPESLAEQSGGLDLPEPPDQRNSKGLMGWLQKLRRSKT
ncbi:hypothetical protein IFO70_17005 [Phormidium tenue FACHB-886]|nr:hypothetical protein [Phormidium tenue FACHB-886]